MNLEGFYQAIRNVPDFPEPGINFKDITPLLLDPPLFASAANAMADAFRESGVEKVLAIESRGFIFGAPIAMELGAGLVLARKAGKLPWRTRRVDYSLEYGSDAIEIHEDAIASGEKVLVVDDVLATGGTAEAAGRVVTSGGGELVGSAFLIELAFLDGRAKLGDQRVWSLLEYE